MKCLNCLTIAFVAFGCSFLGTQYKSSGNRNRNHQSREHSPSHYFLPELNLASTTLSICNPPSLEDMDAAASNREPTNTCDAGKISNARPHAGASNHKHRTSSGPPSKSSASSALKAKQEKRKLRTTTLPSPDLNIPLDEFAEFTAHLKSSQRIFALIGAGLSASSGITTYRGNDARLWRGMEPSTLSDIESFWKDPVLV